MKCKIEEISAGVVIYNDISDHKLFLLLNYPTGHWDFVKGKKEKNETNLQTAIRETKEETNIDDLEFEQTFEESIEYNFRFKNKKIHKKVIFFLAKTKTTKIKISYEHIDYTWLEYNDALKKITYNNAKNILIKARNFLKIRI